MNFNSVDFVLFLLIVLLVYHRLDQRRQNWLLLIASCVFYGWWDPRFLTLIAASTLVDYVCGLRIHAATDPRIRTRWLLVSCVTNLGLLFTFKYFNWFCDSLAAALTGLGVPVDPANLTFRLVLPVGISFYTFQTMSYTIDIYRGTLRPTRSLLDFAVFVSFFPQLVAGPIERASHLLPQVQAPRRVDRRMVSLGAWLLLLGFFKKVVVADNLGRIATTVFDHPDTVTGWDTVLGVWAFAWQIYGDFSGYSDIARGTAFLLGFDLMRNFRIPYFATNPQEFWNRWHISLSTWLRDYLYIPLGGNRHGRWRTYRNLFLTMLLGGIWHGAAWNFVLWGIFHGLLLIGHRLLRAVWGGQGGRSARPWTFKRVVLAAIFFQIGCIGWYLFRIHELADLTRLWHRLALGGCSLLAPTACAFLPVVPLLILHVFTERSGEEGCVLEWPLPARILLYTVLAAGIVALGVRDGVAFIYFQF